MGREESKSRVEREGVHCEGGEEVGGEKDG